MSQTSATPPQVIEDLLAKEARLFGILRECGSVAIGYSGGVDSTYLADVAHEALGGGAHLVMADSPSLPRSEFEEAKRLAAERGWNLHIVTTHELDNEQYRANDGSRCYHCRSETFRHMSDYVRENGVAAIAYGAIMDDLADGTRVGAIAAKEFKVLAPLQMADLYKAEIRALSERRGLPTADKASFACLSSRFPKGTEVTAEGLRMVEAAEEYLRSLGLRQYRARHHGEMVRIEVESEDIARLMEPSMRGALLDAMREAGYKHVAIDLEGYRTGSTA